MGLLKIKLSFCRQNFGMQWRLGQRRCSNTLCIHDRNARQWYIRISTPGWVWWFQLRCLLDITFNFLYIIFLAVKLFQIILNFGRPWKSSQSSSFERLSGRPSIRNPNNCLQQQENLKPLYPSKLSYSYTCNGFMVSIVALTRLRQYRQNHHNNKTKCSELFRQYSVFNLKTNRIPICHSPKAWLSN